MTKDSKTEGGIEIFESPEALQEQLTKTEQFAKSNQRLLIGVGLGILLLVGGVIFFQFYQESRNKEAQAELFPAQFYFEKDSLKKALYGDKGKSTEGMAAIAENYGGTKAGNLAKFYLGVGKLKEGKYDEAITALEDFDADDYLVQARAYSLIGDAYMEKKNTDDAIKYYKKAAEHHPNDQFTPSYLMKLAGAYELAKNLNFAENTYKQIVEDYKDATEHAAANKQLARIQQLLKK